MKKHGYVYKTVCLPTGEYYIGVHRLINKIKPSKPYIGSGLKLQKRIREYGRVNFAHIILEYCETEEEMHRREREILKDFRDIEPNTCLNIANGGKGGIYLPKPITPTKKELNECFIII